MGSSSDNGRHLHAADVQGIARLCLGMLDSAIDAAESLHGRVDRRSAARAAGWYAGVRRARQAAGRRLDSVLGGRAPPGSTARREALLAVLNGIFGDQLEQAGNPLAIPMRLRRGGRALELDKAPLAAALPRATGKVLVLVHGLCQNDLQWQRDGHDHGAALARELGYTAVYLHYNSGRHISVNGRAFSALLEQLVASWPVPLDELAIIGYSMGGLVSRSACHYGRRTRARWLGRLRHLVFLGTPHHGVPLERGGNWLVEAAARGVVTAPLARLGRQRSAGITDLRHGSLVDEDWQGRDRFGSTTAPRHVPLPRGVRCYTVAGSTGRQPGDLRERFLGDGLVPLDTALGRHPEPGRSLRFARGRAWTGLRLHHLELLSRPEVTDQLRRWLGQA